MTVVRGFKARPLTADTWPDLERLFGLPGGSIVRGCWCMYYRRTGQREGFTTGQRKEQNKQALRELADRDLAPGLVGYLDGEPAGWISLGPREDYLRLRRSGLVGHLLLCGEALPRPRAAASPAGRRDHVRPRPRSEGA